MGKFPVDAPYANVIAALEMLGLRILRQKNHISMIRHNASGTVNLSPSGSHQRIKSIRDHERLMR